MRALLSVDDKTGLVLFAERLQRLGWELLATGRTGEALRAAGMAFTPIAELTHSPEMLGGRIKTLHPLIHGGILARRGNAEDEREVAEFAIPLIDLVVVNLYPFVDLLDNAALSPSERIELIDIGGVALLRAAAKNAKDVVVVSQPSQYEEVASLLEAGGVPQAIRMRLAREAFALTAAYDGAIASWLAAQTGELFPERLVLPLERRSVLRYGENPHQRAAFYALAARRGEGITLDRYRQLHGRELSFNNLLDLEAAFEAASDFLEPTVVIIKHTNPCGLASHDNLREAYERAHAGDPAAAYGGIIGVNRIVDEATARAIRPRNYDAIIAPGYEPGAFEVLRRKKKGEFIILALEAPWIPIALPQPGSYEQLDVRRISGGLLVQEPDMLPDERIEFRVVSQRAPTDAELRDLKFAFRVCKHVKSNCVVLAKDCAVLGIGAGQQSRVLAAEIAVKIAGERSGGSVMATDGFFPFPDGVERGIAAGITAVIHPGGSIRDAESIAVCDDHRVAMVVTSGVRHFKH